MPRVNFVKKARKDNPVVKRGESYYWWKFNFGAKHFSITQPKQSQLTQSPFLSELYSIQEDMNFDRDDLEGIVEEVTGRIEALREECESSLENMPEHLQDTSDSGMLLQERIEGLQEWQDGLEGIDLEIDEDGIREEAKSELEDDRENYENEEKFNDAVEEKFSDLKDERIDEIISELEGCECCL